MGTKKAGMASIGSSIYAMMPSSPDPFLEGSTVPLVPSGPEDLLANEEYAGLWLNVKVPQSRSPDHHHRLRPGPQAQPSDSDTQPSESDTQGYPQRQPVDVDVRPKKMEPPQFSMAQRWSLPRPVTVTAPRPNRPDNYKGDHNNAQNQCANVSVYQSTCLFISKLPPNCTAHQLLSCIRGVGKVWALHMCKPTEAYATSAAKLTFWDRAGTDRFLQQVAEGRFRVGNGPEVPHVAMNWHRTKSQKPSCESRVVGLAGPACIVNQAYLEDLFGRCRRFGYTLDQVVTVDRGEPTVYLEFHFASYRCQAAFAAALIRRLIEGYAFHDDKITEQERVLWRSVRRYWGKDPCAIP